MKHTFLVISIILICFIHLADAYAEDVLIWSDEFNYTGLPDNTKWSYVHGDHDWNCGPNNDQCEQQYYTRNRLENTRVEDGVLKIIALKEEFMGHQYTSSLIRSLYKGEWTYGRFEVRAKIPSGIGLLPAIWMRPTDDAYGPGFPSGEIDILEHVGYNPNVVGCAVHTGNNYLATGFGTQTILPEPENNFYIYAVEWTPDKIEFFINDTSIYTLHKPQDNPLDPNDWPFDQRFHLLLNIAVGGSWGGAQGIDDSCFPQVMEIDYVRVYEKRDYTAPFHISATTPENGTLEISPLQTAYQNNTPVSLTITPDEGYELLGWFGNMSGRQNPLSFTINRNSEVHPILQKKGNILSNATFNFNARDWDLYCNNGAAAQLIPGQGELRVDITNRGAEAYHIQFYQQNVVLGKNKQYRLHVKASSPQQRTLSAGITKRYAPWPYYLFEIFSIGPQISTHTFDFTMTDTDETAQVMFNIGDNSSDIIFYDISVTAIPGDWQSDTQYDYNDIVTYNTLQWSCVVPHLSGQNDYPGAGNNNYWVYLSGYPAWDSQQVYTGGDTVSYNGKIYRAKWWTYNQNPELHSDPWDVWEEIQ